MNNIMGNMPLKGLKILDTATMIAAPWSATHLADFGADVIKIEHPVRGCTARKYGKQKNGNGVFWDSLNRNKKGITLNLSSGEGQKIFKELVKEADVVIENYRPGTFERWGIGYDVLSEINPSLIMLRTTGYGQAGPYSKRGGFGTVAEAMSGFASINGTAGGPPTLPGVALADGVAGAFGALAIMIALYERDNSEKHLGQYIDLSLYEPLMRLIEPHIMAYDQLGLIAKPIGNGSLSTAPRNAYQTKDGRWVALSASAQPIVEKLFTGMHMSELINDSRFCTNEARLKNIAELDAIIGKWIRSRELNEVVDILNQSGAVVGPMYDVSQVYKDTHYKFRESFVTLKKENGDEIHVPNVFAKFSRTPGRVYKVAPEKGEDNDEIYMNMLGLSSDKIAELKAVEII